MKPMQPSRRNVLRLAGLAGILASGVAPAFLRAQTRDIVVGGPAGTTQVFNDTVFPLIEKQIGARILYEGTNSASNLTKMRADRASPKFSAVIMDDPFMILAAKDTLLVPVDGKGVPNIGAVVPAAVHRNGLWINYKWPRASAGLYVPRVPSLASYRDAWDPKYKGRIAIPNPKTTEAPFVFAMASQYVTGKPFKEAQYDLDAAFKGLKALKGNVFNIYTNSANTGTMLESGEIWMAMGAFSTYFLSRKAKGAPVDLASPKEGSFALPNGLAKVAGGPHSALADAFINAMLSPPVQTLFMEKFFDSPTNASVAPLPGIASPKDLFAPDWAFVAENLNDVSSRFDREVAV